MLPSQSVFKETLNSQDWIAYMSQPYWVEVKFEVELRFGALMGWMGVEVEFDNCFGDYSCSFTILIFYDYLPSAIRF